MKELSIEEKAKRYDKAIETARKINSGEGVVSPPDWTICEVIFPELKESEDEKIRKALVKQFSDYKRRGENHGFGYSNDKILDWLERQEEKEYGWSEESYDDARLNDIVSKVEYGLQLNKAEINWLKSIKERLHEEIHYWTEEEIEPIISDYLRGTEHYGGMIGRLRCLKPKSPERQDEQEAWSEEDKNMLEWIIGYLENKMLNTPISEERTACKNAIAWLKDLKDRVQPQPKQEWSEEDEETLKCISCLLTEQSRPDYNGSTFWTKEQLVRWNNWLNARLKSIRHQNRWKPSDEQIKALEESIMFLGTSCVSISQFALKSLYRDLKKLREG